MANSNIVFLGGVYDNEKLSVLRKFCTVYIHGHSVGGTNPSLLESMASENFIFAHNNVFNREVTFNNFLYFSDKDSFIKCFDSFNKLTSNQKRIRIEKSKERIINYYNWKRIVNLYKSKISKHYGKIN